MSDEKRTQPVKPGAHCDGPGCDGKRGGWASCVCPCGACHDGDALAAHLIAADERREQALTDALDDGHPGDEPGLGNAWDFAGGD